MEDKAWVPPFSAVADWVRSLPKFGRFADMFEYTEWDMLLNLSVDDLLVMGIPGPASLPLSKLISGLRPTVTTSEAADQAVPDAVSESSIDAPLNALQSDDASTRPAASESIQHSSEDNSNKQMLNSYGSSSADSENFDANLASASSEAINLPSVNIDDHPTPLASPSFEPSQPSNGLVVEDGSAVSFDSLALDFAAPNLDPFPLSAQATSSDQTAGYLSPMELSPMSTASLDSALSASSVRSTLPAALLPPPNGHSPLNHRSVESPAYVPHSSYGEPFLTIPGRSNGHSSLDNNISIAPPFTASSFLERSLSSISDQASADLTSVVPESSMDSLSVDVSSSAVSSATNPLPSAYGQSSLQEGNSVSQEGNSVSQDNEISNSNPDLEFKPEGEHEPQVEIHINQVSPVLSTKAASFLSSEVLPNAEQITKTPQTSSEPVSPEPYIASASASIVPLRRPSRDQGNDNVSNDDQSRDSHTSESNFSGKAELLSQTKNDSVANTSSFSSASIVPFRRPSRDHSNQLQGESPSNSTTNRDPLSVSSTVTSSSQSDSLAPPTAASSASIVPLRRPSRDQSVKSSSDNGDVADTRRKSTSSSPAFPSIPSSESSTMGSFSLLPPTTVKTHPHSALAYKSQHLEIIFHYSYEELNLSSTAEFKNLTSEPLTSLSMLLAVPKYLSVSIKTPSSTTIPPASSHSVAPTTQNFRIIQSTPSVNPVNFAVRAKLSFTPSAFSAPTEVMFSYQFPPKPLLAVQQSSLSVPSTTSTVNTTTASSASIVPLRRPSVGEAKQISNLDAAQNKLSKALDKPSVPNATPQANQSKVVDGDDDDDDDWGFSSGGVASGTQNATVLATNTSTEKPKPTLSAAASKTTKASNNNNDDDDDFFGPQPVSTGFTTTTTSAANNKTDGARQSVTSDDDDFFEDGSEEKSKKKTKQPNKFTFADKDTNVEANKKNKSDSSKKSANAEGDNSTKKTKKTAEKSGASKEATDGKKEAVDGKKSKSKSSHKDPPLSTGEAQAQVEEVVKKPSFFSSLFSKKSASVSSIPAADLPKPKSGDNNEDDTSDRGSSSGNTVSKDMKMKISDFTFSDDEASSPQKKISISDKKDKSKTKANKDSRKEESEQDGWADFEQSSGDTVLSSKKDSKTDKSSKKSSASNADNFFAEMSTAKTSTQDKPVKAKKGEKATESNAAASASSNQSEGWADFEQAPTKEKASANEGSRKKKKGSEDKSVGKSQVVGVALTKEQAASLPLTEPHRRVVFEKMVIAYLLNTFLTEQPEMLTDVNYKLLAYIAACLQAPALTEEEVKRAGVVSSTSGGVSGLVPSEAIGSVFAKRGSLDTNVSFTFTKKKSANVPASSANVAAASTIKSKSGKNSPLSSYSSPSSSSVPPLSSSFEDFSDFSSSTNKSPSKSPTNLSVNTSSTTKTAKMKTSTERVLGNVSSILSSDHMAGLTLEQYHTLPLRPFHERNLAFRRLVYPFVSVKKAGARAPFPDNVRRLITDYLPSPLPYERLTTQESGVSPATQVCGCLIANPEDVEWAIQCTRSAPSLHNVSSHKIFLELVALAVPALTSVPVKLRANPFGLQPTAAEFTVDPATSKKRPRQIIRIPCVFDPSQAQELTSSTSQEYELVFATRFPPDARILAVKVHIEDLCTGLFVPPRGNLDVEAFDQKWAAVTADVTTRSAYSCSIMPCCTVPSVLISSTISKEFWMPLVAWLKKQCPFLLEVNSSKKRTNVLKYVTALQSGALISGKAAALIQITATSLAASSSHIAVKLEIACPGHVLTVSNMLRLILSPLESQS